MATKTSLEAVIWRLAAVLAACVAMGPVRAEDCRPKTTLKVIVAREVQGETCAQAEQAFGKPAAGWRYDGCEVRDCADGCDPELTTDRMTVLVTVVEARRQLRVRYRSAGAGSAVLDETADAEDVGNKLEAIRKRWAGQAPKEGLGMTVTAGEGKPVAILVKVDGREQGEAKDGKWAGKFEPGEYCVRVEARGHGAWEGPVPTGGGGKSIALNPTTAVPAVVERAPPACPPGMKGLPGGSYTMGETGKPASVRPFCLDETEVTVKAYRGCVEAKQCDPVSDGGDKADHPIVNVTWGEAKAYCEAQQARKRLPTEEEWEWAARGTTRGTEYPWGNEKPTNQLCWNGEGNDRKARGFVATCPVGSYPDGDNSPEGIKDLAGNVWEWTNSASDMVSAFYVFRGGGWSFVDPVLISVRLVGRYYPDLRNPLLGFRCAWTP
jgi:hypothetical protein